MGLFDGGAKREARENALAETFANLDIVDALVEVLSSSENDWILNCQGYYDNCTRKVTVGADLFQVEWKSVHREKTPDGSECSVLDGDECVSYAFTKSGYRPLHHHCNEKGKEDISRSRVIGIFASAVQQRLKREFPGIVFDDVNFEDDFSTFTYTVPRLQWKDWF